MLIILDGLRFVLSQTAIVKATPAVAVPSSSREREFSVERELAAMPGPKGKPRPTRHPRTTSSGLMPQRSHSIEPSAYSYGSPQLTQFLLMFQLMTSSSRKLELQPCLQPQKRLPQKECLKHVSRREAVEQPPHQPRRITRVEKLRLDHQRLLGQDSRGKKG